MSRKQRQKRAVKAKSKLVATENKPNKDSTRYRYVIIARFTPIQMLRPTDPTLSLEKVSDYALHCFNQVGRGIIVQTPRAYFSAPDGSQNLNYVPKDRLRETQEGCLGLISTYCPQNEFLFSFDWDLSKRTYDWRDESFSTSIRIVRFGDPRWDIPLWG